MRLIVERKSTSKAEVKPRYKDVNRSQTQLFRLCDKFNKIKNILQLWPSKYDYWLRKCKHCRILFSVHLNTYFVELFQNGEYPQYKDEKSDMYQQNWQEAFKWILPRNIQR